MINKYYKQLKEGKLAQICYFEVKEGSFKLIGAQSFTSHEMDLSALFEITESEFRELMISTQSSLGIKHFVESSPSSSSV